MLATQIDRIIDGFYSKNLSAILIDGKWGVGKTHNTKKAIDGKYDYSYISLFGIDSYNTLMARLSDKIPTNNLALSNGVLFFYDTITEKEKNGHIIVFDDLERISGKIDFETVYGVFDSLFKLGFRILCLTNSEEIDEELLDKFNKFKEKVFDCCYIVEADYKSFSEIVGEKEITPTQSLIEDANGNWRIIIRASKYYKEIVEYFNNRQMSDFFEKAQINHDSFYRCVVIATSCIASPTTKEPKFENNEYLKLYYDEDVKNYGKGVANKFYCIFDGNKENNTLKNMSRLIIKSIQVNDYSFIAEVLPNDNTDPILNTYPFNYELFFLDDEGKALYKTTFFEKIDKFDFTNKKHLNIVRTLLINMIDVLTDDEKTAIINKLAPAIKDVSSSEALPILSSEDAEKNALLNSFKKALDDSIKSINKTNEEKMLEKAFEDKDYAFLTNYLYNSKYSIDEKALSIADSFSNNNYFLPDLSKTITYEEWSYCHEIASFVSKFDEHIQKFIEVLRKQSEMNNSKALIERCNALIRYNFRNSDYYCVFEFKSNKK